MVKRQHWSKCLYKILKIVFYKNLNTVQHTQLSFLAIVYINSKLHCPQISNPKSFYNTRRISQVNRSVTTTKTFIQN